MNARRGIVIASVAVVGAAALWIAVALIQVSSVAVAASDLDVRRTNRLLRLESALQVLLLQLADQRYLLAQGMPAGLPETLTLWSRGTRTVEVQLVSDDEGQVLRPEAAAVDVNSADLEALTALEGIDEVAAQDLLDIRQATQGQRLADDAAVHAALDLELDAPALKQLTVYAVEPVWTAGRIVVQPWSGAVASEAAGVLSPEAVSVLETLPEGSPETWASQVAAASPSPEVWGEILFHTAPAQDGFRMGCVDLNTASEAVLATLPGIDIAKASHLTTVRDGLDVETRQRVSWPWTEGVLPRSAEALLLDRVTVGSWTWRCTLAIGDRSSELEEAVLQDVLLYSVVFDVAGETPRIAMLRNVQLDGVHLGPIPLLQHLDDDKSEEAPEPPPPPGDEFPGAPPDDAPPDPSPDDTEPEDEPSQPGADDPRLGRWR